MLTIIYIYFNYTIGYTYRPFKLHISLLAKMRHVDEIDWVLL